MFQKLVIPASSAVSTALDGLVWLEQFTVVVPTHWREAKCGLKLRSPKGNTKHKVSDSDELKISQDLLTFLIWPAGCDTTPVYILMPHPAQCRISIQRELFIFGIWEI